MHVYIYRVVCVYSFVLNSLYTRIRGIYNLFVFHVSLSKTAYPPYSRNQGKSNGRTKTELARTHTHTHADIQYYVKNHMCASGMDAIFRTV